MVVGAWSPMCNVYRQVGVETSRNGRGGRRALNMQPPAPATSSIHAFKRSIFINNARGAEPDEPTEAVSRRGHRGLDWDERDVREKH